MSNDDPENSSPSTNRHPNGSGGVLGVVGVGVATTGAGLLTRLLAVGVGVATTGAGLLTRLLAVGVGVATTGSGVLTRLGPVTGLGFAATTDGVPTRLVAVEDAGDASNLMPTVLVTVARPQVAVTFHVPEAARERVNRHVT